jgi:hypothetical protein
LENAILLNNLASRTPRLKKLERQPSKKDESHEEIGCEKNAKPEAGTERSIGHADRLEARRDH